MKRRTFLFFLFLYLGFCSGTEAQQHRATGHLPSYLYAGTGPFFLSRQMKTHSMLKDGWNYRVGYYHQLVSLNSRKSAQLGLEVRFDYTKYPADLRPPEYLTGLRYNNGSGSPVALTLSLEKVKKKPDSYHYLAGPSVLFSFGRYFLQPSLLAGYASVSQEHFRFSDSIRNVSDPSENREIVFYSSGHETNNGFVLVPGIRGGARLNSNLSAFLSLDYSMGSRQQFTDYMFLPEGAPVNGIYSFGQVKNGTTIAEARSGSLRLWALQIQLCLTLNARRS